MCLEYFSCFIFQTLGLCAKCVNYICKKDIGEAKFVCLWVFFLFLTG